MNNKKYIKYTKKVDQYGGGFHDKVILDKMLNYAKGENKMLFYKYKYDDGPKIYLVEKYKPIKTGQINQSKCDHTPGIGPVCDPLMISTHNFYFGNIITFDPDKYYLGVVYQDKDKNISDFQFLPTGTSKVNESSEQAAEREIKEELSIKPTEIKSLRTCKQLITKKNFEYDWNIYETGIKENLQNTLLPDTIPSNLTDDVTKKIAFIVSGNINEISAILKNHQDRSQEDDIAGLVIIPGKVMEELYNKFSTKIYCK